jgi:hypothetical protein
VTPCSNRHSRTMQLLLSMMITRTVEASRAPRLLV